MVSFVNYNQITNSETRTWKCNIWNIKFSEIIYFLLDAKHCFDKKNRMKWNLFVNKVATGNNDLLSHLHCFYIFFFNLILATFAFHLVSSLRKDIGLHWKDYKKEKKLCTLNGLLSCRYFFICIEYNQSV